MITFVLCAAVQAKSELKLSNGQTVYVPVYSQIFTGDRDRLLYLSLTLSIRNTDPDFPITVVAVNYYDSNGKLVIKFVEKPILLDALASTYYTIKESDKRGGAGPNFIVTWKAERKVTAPVIEAVMISTRGQQGISFTSSGRVIKEKFK
ncbi:MAG: DUF3124 domain-containing protein [candidate division WOR-3 bacterium]|nr:MAG: DUF3124 domain-containing protein [candidate division WOR-3 bacterium]